MTHWKETQIRSRIPPATARRWRAWWDQRSALKTQDMRVSLVVSVSGPGVYAAIQPRVEAASAATSVEV